MLVFIVRMNNCSFVCSTILFSFGHDTAFMSVSAADLWGFGNAIISLLFDPRLVRESGGREGNDGLISVDTDRYGFQLIHTDTVSVLIRQNPYESVSYKKKEPRFWSEIVKLMNTQNTSGRDIRRQIELFSKG